MKAKVTKFAAITAVIVLAWTAAAYAADTDTDVTLSNDVLLPTEVGIGNNSFSIKVWLTGSYNKSTAGEISVVNKYDMATDGVVTPDATSVTAITIPAGNYNYGDGTNQDCASSPRVGCRNNPHVVPATLVVAAGTPNNTTGSVIASMTGDQALTADPTPDTGHVKVVVSTTCTFSDVKQPINLTAPASFNNISTYKYGARGVVPVKFDLTCGTNRVDTQAEADSHPVTLRLAKISGEGGDNQDTLESPAAGSSNTGNLFRFDDGADQFIYNRAIQGLNRGVWELTASTAGATDGVAYFKII